MPLFSSRVLTWLGIAVIAATTLILGKLRRLLVGVVTILVLLIPVFAVYYLRSVLRAGCGVDELNTFVDFHADFPYRPGWTADSRIGIPGKEVAELLAGGLPRRGIDVLGVEGMEYGHLVRCRSGNRLLIVEVTVDDPFAMERWNVQCYPEDGEGFLPSWLRRPDLTGYIAVLNAIHLTLAGSDAIRDIRWFPRFETPRCLDERNAEPWPVRPAKDPKALEHEL